MVLPLDMPDDYPWQPGSRRGLVNDFGELATRLGSPNTYDRRGETAWLYKPIYGVAPWTVTGGGTGYKASLCSQFSLFDGFSLKLVSGSTGAHLLELQKYYDVIDVMGLGFEASYAPGEEVSFFQIYADYSDGESRYRAAFKLDLDANELLYLSSTGVYIKIDDIISIYGNGVNFLYIKMVLDLQKHQYTRFLFGQHEYRDISPALQNMGAGLSQYYRLFIQQVSTAGNNGSGYLGHVILTVNDY